jgi:hypothetical protein
MFWKMWDALHEYPDVEIRGVEEYSKDTVDFSPYVRRLVGLFYLRSRAGEICADSKKGRDAAKKEPTCFARDELPPIVDFEVLFIPDSAEKVRQIVPMLSYHGVRGVQLLGANLWNNEAILDRNSLDAMQGAIFVDGFSSAQDAPEVQIFMNRYRKNFGEAPDILAAQAFDTMQILKRAESSQGLRSRGDVRRHLRDMPPWNGATGKTVFAKNGQAERELFHFIVDGDRIRPLVR